MKDLYRRSYQEQGSPVGRQRSAGACVAWYEIIFMIFLKVVEPKARHQASYYSPRWLLDM